MDTNVNLAAPVGALMLLATGLLIFLVTVWLVESLIVRKMKRAKVIAILYGAITGLYLASVLGFSFASQEKVLARGQEKHFCELDCHLAYSIAKVTQRNSTSTFSETVITIKTRFDETTIAPWRGNGLLYPNRRVLTLFDDHGNRYVPASQTGTAFTTPLRPGESYTTDVVFNLPRDAKPAKLLINEGDWITHLVIGHENSPLHSKTEFEL